MIHYYNGKYDKNIENVEIMFAPDIIQDKINALCVNLHMMQSTADMKLNVDKKIDKETLKIFRDRLSKARHKDMFVFRLDGGEINAYGKMSDEMCMLKIKDFLQEGDKILINSFGEYNNKIIFALTEDMKNEIPKYYNKKTYDWNEFEMHDLLLDAGIIESASSGMIPTETIPTLDDELENASREKVLDAPVQSLQKDISDDFTI